MLLNIFANIDITFFRIKFYNLLIHLDLKEIYFISTQGVSSHNIYFILICMLIYISNTWLFYFLGSVLSEVNDVF